jgi:hypothetical protein
VPLDVALGRLLLLAAIVETARRKIATTTTDAEERLKRRMDINLYSRTYHTSAGDSVALRIRDSDGSGTFASWK